MTTSILSLFQAGLFRKHNFAVSQLKHLTPKTTGLGNCKIDIKETEILRNLSRF